MNKFYYWSILVLTLIFSIHLSAQGVIAEYDSVLCFADYKRPVIGIFKIQGYDNIEEQLYEALKKNNDWKGKFKFFPYKTLESQRHRLGIYSLTYFDREVFSILKNDEDFQIDIILMGQEISYSEMEIILVETINRNILFHQIYKNSENSTPLDDLLKLFTESKRTNYKEWISGQEFKIVPIGSQIWTAENLNVSHFSNGEIIPEAKTNEEWIAARAKEEPAWCYYENDSKNADKYGRLYNWYAVNDKRGLAPDGWHIPTSEEFGELSSSILENSNSLKSVGEGVGNGSGTNASGFSAKLSGYRGGDSNFGFLGFGGLFWSSTEYNGGSNAYYMYLNGSDCLIGLNGYSEAFGFSVRLVRNLPKH